jgi:photosystem II stability/assembly factor-like uncharacterized protein
MRKSSVSTVSPVLLAACGLVFAVSGAACGPASTTSIKGPTGPTSTAQKAPPPESPARWSLHPTKGGSLRAKLELGPMGALYVGDGGERWLDKRDGNPATAAATLLPETIAAAGRASDGKGVLLVGASGTIYTASEPLGPVTGKKPPTQKLRNITAGKSAIVAIAENNQLVRTVDAGATWNKVDLPAGAGTLASLAMSEQGAGIALFAPQRALVTTDDGATWQVTPTPGVGARRVVLDVNGDLIIEGLEASAVLRLSPARFERVSGAPKSEGFELALGEGKASLGYAHAVASGHGAFLGARYVEVIAEPDDATRWRVAIGPIGGNLEAKRVPELNGCTQAFVGGDPAPGGAIYVACDGQGKKLPPPPMGSSGTGPKWQPEPVPQLHLYRSDDDGKTWKDDGTVGSEHTDSGHVWVAPDKSLMVEGACKRAKYGCGEGPPLIRVNGAKAFAKMGLPKGILKIGGLAFSPTGTKAYAVGKGYAGPLSLLVSSNGGKDFTRTALPSVTASDPKKDPLSPSRVEAGTISVDESGVVYATAHDGQDWIVYTSDDEGQTIKARALAVKADAVAMVGKRGFAYDHKGKGWETADGGATWVPVAAPPISDGTTPDRTIACGTYGCFVGDRATRVGWGPGDGGAAIEGVAPPTGAAYSTPLKCNVEGAWSSLGPLINPPSAYEADAGAGARWMAIKNDPFKGGVSVVIGKAPGKDGKVETKEVTLFGPAGKDTATDVKPQVEGVAAIRYAFKRETPAKGSTVAGPIIANQKVDVDVAWYVAATGKVFKATIRGAGPLDPRDVIAGSKDSAGHASAFLLSMAQGGVHVRPFGTKAEAPLYFVHEGGKVDRLSWPELPSKDASGSAILPRPDAVRVGNRSVVLGVTGPGLQLVSAWANDAGTAWESRVWGLWPDLRGTRPGEEVAWDFTYVTNRPSIVAQWGGGGGVGPVAWAVPIKASEVDPSEAIELPTQKLLADPPKACDAGALATPRIVAPYVRGSRHPLLISGEGNEVVLATAAAVMHGSGKDACVTAFEATSTSGGTTSYTAIVSTDDLAHAALFKVGTNGQEVSVRSMTCTYAPGPLPTSLTTVEGFN